MPCGTVSQFYCHYTPTLFALGLFQQVNGYGRNNVFVFFNNSYVILHCDLDLEDSKPNLSRDTPADRVQSSTDQDAAFGN